MRIIALMFISSLTQFASLGVIATAISQLHSIDASGSLSASVSIANVIGISFAGLFLGSLLNKFQGFSLGFVSPLVSILFVLPLPFIHEYYLILGSVILISIVAGLDNPNNNSTLNKLIVDPKEKAHVFSKYSTISQASVLLSPLLATGLIFFGAII